MTLKPVCYLILFAFAVEKSLIVMCLSVQTSLGFKIMYSKQIPFNLQICYK